MLLNAKRLLLFLLAYSILAASVLAQTPAPDLTKEPTLYVVGYAHLDTQWRWEYPQVINEFLPHTMRDNFALFEKYPNYVFNFSGANRYRMMKEYWPSDYARLKSYVAAGRWFPSGSAMEESDANTLSAASIVRQVLYGSHGPPIISSPTPLKVTESSLENARYRLKLDQNGDVASIFDKTLNKELLAAPLRLALQTERPRDWPAWNMDWADRQWLAKEVPVEQSNPPDASAPKTQLDPYAEMTGIKPGFIKHTPLGWFASHYHTADGKSAADRYSYLFVNVIELPRGARTLTLPDNDKLRIMAVTVSDEGAQVLPAHPLYDTLERARD